MNTGERIVSLEIELRELRSDYLHLSGEVMKLIKVAREHQALLEAVTKVVSE